MCVIIFAGVKPSAQVETGIDMFVDEVSAEGDYDYFKANSGKGKRFPGGPTCRFQGKDIPCFTRWSPKGSMTSTILREIVEELDARNVPYREGEDVMPFLLLDGHGSRMETPIFGVHHW